MSTNHLEQLVAEWYEFQGYFVRRNILVGQRKAGGHETELDVVAFHPEKRHLIHMEPSLDTDSWSKRELRYQKKFMAGRKYIPGLFPQMNIPKEIDQIALFLYGSGKTHAKIGGGQVKLVSEMMTEIFDYLDEKRYDVLGKMVPEQFPLIRTLFYAAQFREKRRGDEDKH